MSFTHFLLKNITYYLMFTEINKLDPWEVTKDLFQK